MKKRSGLATFVRFISRPDGFFVTLKRNGQTVTLPLDLDLGNELGERFGVRSRNRSGASMTPIVGTPCRYRESTQGVIVELEILAS